MTWNLRTRRYRPQSDPVALSGSARMAVEELNLVKLKAKFAKQKSRAYIAWSIHPRSHDAGASSRIEVPLRRRFTTKRFQRIITAWLDATGVADTDVDFDPSEVGEELGRIIVDGAKKRALAYQATARPEIINFSDFKVSIVTSCAEGDETPKPTIDQVPVVSKETFIPGMMVAGAERHRWSNSLHPAYSFDSWPEVRVGWLLDHDADVDWWVRNQPRRLRIRTPAGLFFPDFLVMMLSGEILLLEVKGSIYWGPSGERAED